MPSNRIKSRIGLFFIAAVVAPSLVLSLIAARSIQHEEAYLEKNIKDTLQAEVDHVASLVNQEIKNIRRELDQSITVRRYGHMLSTASAIKDPHPIIRIPFLLSSRRAYIWPSADKLASNKYRNFFKWSPEFFTDRTSIPVYENIIFAYEDEIIRSQLAGQQEAEYRRQTSPSSSNKLSSLSTQKGYTKQIAQSQFVQYEPVRETIYKQASAKGQKFLKRNIQLSPKGKGGFIVKSEPQEDAPPKSMFISEPQTFSQILEKNTSGIIPHFQNGRLELLYYHQNVSDYIAGGVIDIEKLKDRLLAVLPNIYTPARILTILDENGQPVISPDRQPDRDWKRPFTAAEISALLPNWEVTAYLTNPLSIRIKANRTAFYIWTLISILLVSISAGSFLVLRSLHSEMLLAQQKTTFVANVSHELKTPLTSIRIFAEMLKENRQPDTAKQRQYLDIMVSETRRLTRLINNVLDFSRMGQRKKVLNLQRTDMSQLCADIIEEQKIRLEYNGFRVSYRGPDTSVFLTIDPEAMTQAILNLISNAEKYSHDVKEVGLVLESDKQEVTIHILDRGIGIPEQDAQKIFEEFYRVDDTLTAKSRGSGLGLTIARHIVKEHRGRIDYRPRSCGGSDFAIRLPKREVTR